MIIVNPAVAKILEGHGYVRDRDFLVSEPLSADCSPHGKVIEFPAGHPLLEGRRRGDYWHPLQDKK